ncbi:carbon-nitrogen hydrolase [Aspergillus eucalypticola CBS 122712]|uniref:Carbon-nitrogen hydrolase n=1 Tax=Aspergillus eucalypticola (strain CBS 122712 / IBT 29274) TaxID=1448314 RepID=A0A317W6T5_ASPEC|nr:carbon-nitrogen hydrolase [Aspergillus eucalypticola CBS 122712]PWY80972.1 carbon-nitrogen hydrolase [Aspergillus eucalypticola CBS 122712]
MSPRKLTLAIAHPTITSTSPSQITQLAHSAASKGAHLLVIPSYATPAAATARNKSPRDQYLKLFNCAHDLSDPGSNPECHAEKKSKAREILEHLAQETKLFLIVGLLERACGNLYHTVVYIHPADGLVEKRRCFALTGAAKTYLSPGQPHTSPITVNCKSGLEVKIGVGLCEENYRPLIRQELYTAGIQVYISLGGVSYLDGGDSDGGDETGLWESLLRTVAVEGRVFVLGSYTTSQPAHQHQFGSPTRIPSWQSSPGAKKRSLSITAEGPHEIVWPEVRHADGGGAAATVGPRKSVMAEGPHEIVWPGQSNADMSVNVDGEMSPGRVEQRQVHVGGSGSGSGREGPSGESGCGGAAWIVGPFGEILAGSRGGVSLDDDGLLVREVDLEDCIRGRWDRDLAGYTY